MTVRGVNAGNVQALVDSMKPHYPMAICRVFGQSGESRASAASQRAAIEILDEALSGSSDPAVQQRLRDRIAAIGEGSQASVDSKKAAIKRLNELLRVAAPAVQQWLRDRIAAISVSEFAGSGQSSSRSSSHPTSSSSSAGDADASSGAGSSSLKSVRVTSPFPPVLFDAIANESGGLDDAPDHRALVNYPTAPAAERRAKVMGRGGSSSSSGVGCSSSGPGSGCGGCGGASLALPGYHCAMCGCAGREHIGGGGGTDPEGGTVTITLRNKMVCTECQSGVWQFQQDQSYFKWCKVRLWGAEGNTRLRTWQFEKKTHYAPFTPRVRFACCIISCTIL